MTIHNKVLRDALNSMAFNTVSKPIRTTNTDYMEPVIIPCGQDSWEKIGKPSSFMEIGSSFHMSLNIEPKKKKPLPKDPTKEGDFREPVIDEVRAQKDEELLNFMRHSNVRLMFENIVE